MPRTLIVNFRMCFDWSILHFQGKRCNQRIFRATDAYSLILFLGCLGMGRCPDDRCVQITCNGFQWVEYQQSIIPAYCSIKQCTNMADAWSQTIWIIQENSQNINDSIETIKSTKLSKHWINILTYLQTFEGQLLQSKLSI